MNRIIIILMVYAIMGWVSYKVTYKVTLAILKYNRPFDK